MRFNTDPLFRCECCRLHSDLCICSEAPALALKNRLTVVMHRDEMKKTTNTGRPLALAIPAAKVLIRGLPRSPLQELHLDPVHHTARISPNAQFRVSGMAGQSGRSGNQNLDGPGCDFDVVEGRNRADMTGVDSTDAEREKGPSAILTLFPSEESVELNDGLLDSLHRGAGEAKSAAWPPQSIHLMVADGNWNQSARMVRREPIFAGSLFVHLPPGPPGIYSFRRQFRGEGLCTMEATARALSIIEGRETGEALMEFLGLVLHRIQATRGRSERSLLSIRNREEAPAREVF